MKTYRIRQQQLLPLPPEEAWYFFSNPDNLGHITPAKMKFRIVFNSAPGKMQEGQHIWYRIRLLPLLWVDWLTEIAEVRPFRSFIDVQKSGPYASWKHKHIFKAVSGGVEMTDEVEYAVPLGWLGTIAHRLFVGSELKSIFQHRRMVLEQKFAKKTSLERNVW
jgi:ligand-binding SRPBCC domain-containing protein